MDDPNTRKSKRAELSVEPKYIGQIMYACAESISLKRLRMSRVPIPGLSEKIPEIYDEENRPERSVLGNLCELLTYGKELIHLNLSECSLTSKALC